MMMMMMILTLNVLVHTQMRLNCSCAGKRKKIHALVLADRKLKLHEIADELKLLGGNVFAILHKHLSVRKLCSKCIPRFLTVDQKQQRVEDSKRCLQLFQRNRKGFLRKYVIMDKTWIHHFTPESNKLSAEWAATDERFWDVQGILFIDYLKMEEPSITNIK